MRRYLPALLSFLLISSGAVSAQTLPWQPSAGHKQTPIWPKGAPGAVQNGPPEVNITTPKDRTVAGKPVVRLSNVSEPTMTLYEPANAMGVAPAVVVFPGGGYHHLAIDIEGTEVCDLLTAHGIACILLKYRVPDSGPYPKSPAALQDAQRTLGLVREHAAEWHLDSHRIGVLGFSAGAHLAAALSNHFDKRLYDPVDAADTQSCRPDFAVVIYPGYIALADQGMAPNPDLHPTAQTPPAFIVQAEDDPVHVENAITYFLLLKNANVPAELHVFAQGGHGYGLRPTGLPVANWPELMLTWLHTIHVLPATQQ